VVSLGSAFPVSVAQISGSLQPSRLASSGAVLCRKGLLSDSDPLSAPSPKSSLSRFGPLLLRTLDGNKVGSYDYNKRVASADEALVTAKHLRDFEPGLWKAMLSATAISDPLKCVDQANAMLAHHGAPCVARARRSLVALNIWLSGNRSWVVLDHRGPSVAHLAMFASDRLQSARANGHQKDHSAKSVISGLVSAVKIFGAPLDIARLKNSAVSAACERSSDAMLAPSAHANIPLAFLCQLEDLALGPESYLLERGRPQPPEYDLLCEEAVDHVRGLWVTAALAVRLTDGLRLQRASDAKGVLLPLERDSIGRFAHMVVGKSKSGAPMRAILPAFGITPGVDRWLPQYLEKVGSAPSLFPRLSFVHGSSCVITSATGRHPSGLCCSDEHYSKLLLSVLTLPPLCIGSSERFDLGITGRARAMLAEVVETWRWPAEDASVIGDWVPPPSTSGGKRQKRSAPTCKTYAPLSISDRQLLLRRRLMNKLAAFVGDRDWSSVIPLQNNAATPVSCAFLLLADSEEDEII
jgi:hypothetical protein